jgi:predicted MFS family arabinose efflux permease
VLRSPRLRRILSAYVVNRLGTFFGFIALSVSVYDQTHSAIAVAALLFANQALPAFAVPALVARVESSRRGRELSGLYLVEAVVTAALAVLIGGNFALAPILVLAAVDGTAALAASALLRAEVARVARAELAPDGDAEAAVEAEREGNAALNVGFSLTFVTGPAIGGVIVAAAGASTALFLDVGSFVICALMLLDLHPRVTDAEEESVAGRLAAAWRHINETPRLRTLLVAELVALILFETGGPIEVAYAKSTLHAGDRGYGLLLTTWGLGAVVGSLLFARFVGRELAALLGCGTLAIGFAYAGFGVAHTIEVACAVAFVGGIGNGLQWPSMISIVQKLTPQRLQGRMMGALESLGALALAIGLPLGGVLATVTSPRTAFLVIGSAAMAMTVVLVPAARWGRLPGNTQGALEGD